MKRSVNTGNILVPLAFISLVLALWEFLVRWRDIPEYILPGPVQITRTLAHTSLLMMDHARATILESLGGFALAIVLALVIAFVMNEIPLVRQALYPIIITSQTVPIVSVAPLLVIWFGYGVLPKIIVVILVCFFPIVISLLNGLAAVDPDYLQLFRSMRAGRWDTFRMVTLPLALPSFFAGLKISAAYSVMGAVIGEWLGAKEGLGYYMTLAQHSFHVDRVFAAIVVITLFSMALFGLVGLVERLVIPWNASRGQTP
ncbi:MAG: ABC transporter permease [Syntrophomonadales bacterium]|jgi:ABC-type nitrate/sulfonate/bicarbonate transport system permease component